MQFLILVLTWRKQGEVSTRTEANLVKHPNEAAMVIYSQSVGLPLGISLTGKLYRSSLERMNLEEI